MREAVPEHVDDSPADCGHSPSMSDGYGVMTLRLWSLVTGTGHGAG